jgi:hypothetical protein
MQSRPRTSRGEFKKNGGKIRLACHDVTENKRGEKANYSFSNTLLKIKDLQASCRDVDENKRDAAQALAQFDECNREVVRSSSVQVPSPGDGISTNNCRSGRTPGGKIMC